jgi:hypothetical protein
MIDLNVRLPLINQKGIEAYQSVSTLIIALCYEFQFPGDGAQLYAWALIDEHENLERAAAADARFCCSRIYCPDRISLRARVCIHVLVSFSPGEKRQLRALPTNDTAP